MVCYESNCGGETIATESLLRYWSKNNNISIKHFSVKPLIKTDSLSYHSWVFGSIFKWLKIILKSKSQDWIYTTTYTAGVAASILKPFFHHKICFHYHGTRIPDKDFGSNIFKNITQIVKYQLTYWLHLFFINNTDLIIVPSPNAAKILESEIHNFKREKVKVVINGVDLFKFKPINVESRFELRNKYGIKGSESVLLSIGRLNQKKGILLLLEVFSNIVKNHSNAILIIAHPKPIRPEERNYKKELVKKIADLNIQKHILWIEDEKHIPNLYHICDLVISLSQQEIFPLIFLESLATKTIYVSNQVGGITRNLSKINEKLVINNKKPEKISQQLTQILSISKTRRKYLVNQGYQLIKNYSHEKTGKCVLVLLTLQE